MNFKEIREFLALAYANKFIDDEEFLLLYDAHFSKNLELPYKEYGKFDLQTIEDDECIAEFRFAKHDIPFLVQTLGIPDYMWCYQGTRFSGIEGICLLLRRLAYPCRYSDLIPRFGRAEPEISMITKKMTDFVFDEHSHRVLQWNHFLLSPPKLQGYADAISARGAALDNCFGFIDGTVRPICKPATHNGHKRIHALKFQAVALPNGMIANLYGPVEGKKHDSGMLADSRLLDMLQRHAFSPAGSPMCLYGDPAYPLRIHLQAPFRITVPNQDMEDFNKSMSAVRISVEWLFGDIASTYKFIDYKKKPQGGIKFSWEDVYSCSNFKKCPDMFIWKFHFQFF